MFPLGLRDLLSLLRDPPAAPPQAAPSLRPFDLDYPLFCLSDQDPWRLRDACEGTQIFGATGSGKTSGSGATIAKSFLRSGYGGLVLTAKPDERVLWERYCRETGREESLIVFSQSNTWRFNFLDYELNRAGPGAGDTENLVRLFFTVLEISEGRKGQSPDPFWERAARQMLRNAIDLLAVSKRRLVLSEIYEVITSAPASMDDLTSDAWKANSLCMECIAEGEARAVGTRREHDFNIAAKYWLREFPNLAEKTRSVIVTTFTSMADCFLRGRLHDLFCTDTNITPELTHEGKIIVLDLPIKEYGEIGRFAQVLFKYIWQGAAERRNVEENPRPIFLWADEAQYFVTSNDKDFQMTARSARAPTVYLTQNISNYYAMMGENKDHTEALLGNLATKIFHANGSAVTNQWAADTFARSWQGRTTSGYSESREDRQKGGSQNTGYSETLEYDVQPQSFTALRKGGEENHGYVDAYVFQSGRIWKGTGKNSIKVTFKQGA